MTQKTGPIEDREWPTELDARVVLPGSTPAIHGYDVQSDLATFYGFGHVVLLAFAGNAVEDAVSRAFDVAMIFASPLAIGEGPTHAAALARVCGARTSAIFSVAATTLAEQARELMDEHEPILPRLATASVEFEASFRARDDGERQAVARLRVALGDFCERVPAIQQDLRLDTAIIAVFLACGVHRREQIEMALCIARLAPTCAEALAVPPGDLRAYPMNVPQFDYERP